MTRLATADGTAAAEAAMVEPAARLRGELFMPGDKSISHRALMLALLATGESRITGAGDGADVRSTAGIVRALGAEVARSAEGVGGATYRVQSRGVTGIVPPTGVLDCGNSGTTLRLMAGLLTGGGIGATLDGDDSLRQRPVARIIEPLRAMGARISARDGNALPPVTIEGRTGLRSIDWSTPVPSAQVKSAILLAGLHAIGTTSVHEAVATRDHTERMLRARGVKVRSRSEGAAGAVVEIDGGATVAATDERVPGDPSAAAFWLVAAAIHPDADLTLRGVGTNPTRRAIVDLLVRMGAAIDGQSGPGTIGAADIGEPVADLVVRSSRLEGIEVSAAEVAAAIDEIPILCLAATQAYGRTAIHGAGELRHKEADRLAGIATGLRALGARIDVVGDDIVIDGPTPLHGTTTDSLNDHRLAMTFAIAGLIASGRTTVGRPSSVTISYPGFFSDLERIRA